MTDDTERYGAPGGVRDSFDRQFLLLIRKASEQGLRLWMKDTVFYITDNDDTVRFETDKTELDALTAITAWLVANEAKA